MMLSEFLELAKTKAIIVVLFNIENVTCLASNKGLDIIGTFSTALIPWQQYELSQTSILN